MQYIGDLAYLFNIYVNVSTFIQSSSRIQDTTLSRFICCLFLVFFFFGGNFGLGGGGVEKCHQQGWLAQWFDWDHCLEFEGMLLVQARYSLAYAAQIPMGLLSGPSSYDWRTFMRECLWPPHCFSLSAGSLVDGCHYGKAHVGSFTN